MTLPLQNRSFSLCELLLARAARIGCAVLCADFLTMLLMNVARLNTHWLPFLFFGLFGAAAFWMFHNRLIPAVHPSYLSTTQQHRLTFFVILVAFLLAVARLPYLMEGHLHHLVGPVVYDDTWHFQEINSLVHSVRYPAQCSLVPNRYFSLYYAPWMMIAALYLAIPIHGFTIKAAFAIGCAIYQILIYLTLLYIGIARANSRKHLYWAIYLIACWAGMESPFRFDVLSSTQSCMVTGPGDANPFSLSLYRRSLGPSSCDCRRCIDSLLAYLGWNARQKIGRYFPPAVFCWHAHFIAASLYF